MECAYHPQQQCPPWRKPRWRSTLVAQVLILFALYGALSIGSSQTRRIGGEMSGYIKTRNRGCDIYFISVEGGSRPRDQQMRLLRQMEKVARSFRVKFVMNLSAQGKNDSLMQNATRFSPYLRVPWYTSSPSSEIGSNYFQRKIKLPRGRTLDLIYFDPVLWQVSSEEKMKQLRSLTKTLATTNSTCRILFGFHPGVVESLTAKKMNLDELGRIFSDHKSLPSPWIAERNWRRVLSPWGQPSDNRIVVHRVNGGNDSRMDG